MNFAGKSDFFCLWWREMFTTDTIVYLCEQNQKPVRKRTGPCERTQVNVCFRNQTGLIGLRFGTCVNVALGEFRGSSYNNSFIIK